MTFICPFFRRSKFFTVITVIYKFHFWFLEIFLQIIWVIWVSCLRPQAIPYFIWPNVSPFVKELSLVKAVPCQEDFRSIIENDKRLSNARRFVREARKNNLGVFNSGDPLLLIPFELRFILDRKTGKNDKPFDCNGNTSTHDKKDSPLSRYVIDLSKADDPILMRPSEYYKIEKVEDRLFVPDHYIPLFKIK